MRCSRQHRRCRQAAGRISARAHRGERLAQRRPWPSCRRPGTAPSGAPGPAAATAGAAGTAWRRRSAPARPPAALTAASSAAIRSGAARSIGQRAGDRVVVAVRQRGTAHRRLEHARRIGQRRLLADHHAADDEVLRARDLRQIAEQMRLAGAEAAGDAEARVRGVVAPDVVQLRIECVFDAGLAGAHQPHGGAVRHARAQAPRSRCGLPGSSAHHHQRGQRILPVARPHVGPDPHLQRLVGIERPPAVAGRSAPGPRSAEHEQARQMLDIVDDLAQHLVEVHHRRGRIAQVALAPSAPAAARAASPASAAAPRRRPCAANGTARSAWRARWCG